MPSFHYKAVNRAGQVHEGVMEAPDEAHVITSLQRNGDIPMRTALADGKSVFSRLLAIEWGGTGLRRQQVANFTRELAIMLGAGQDLDLALRFLVTTAAKPREKKILQHIRATVRDGGSLAAALSDYKKSFSKVYIGLVRAGEAGGALAATLDRLAMLLERQRRLESTVRSAMIYPGMMAFVTVGSVTLLLTEVLPQFVPLFAQNGVALPGSLLGAGSFIRHDGPYILVGLCGLGLLARRWLRQAGPRLAVDRLLLRLPIAGPLLRETLAARFTRTLGALLLNGVPLIAALDIVRDAIGNRAAVQAVERATASAKGGAGLARPLAESMVFPARTMHLLQLGEETAQLGAIALRAADIHDEKIQLGVQQLVALLVPVLTIVMGVIIGGIVSSLMLAMLSLNNLAG
jgi:general secretion pathway protein F